MIILKMHASFGKLNSELTLHDGLNLLCLPNEAGKSTWSAFLLAMLYGIDTSEKPSAANDRLPAKERYKPWDGRSMHGRIELVHNDRYITIERKTHGRIPMGHFSAYDTKSGAPIEELTGENCGKMLCGVERSVFERTAFIRQLGMSVSHDDALLQRMNSLVTSGEEDVSAVAIANDLHKRHNRLTRESTKLAGNIGQLQNNISALYTLQEDLMHLRAQRDEAHRELERLEGLCERVDRAKTAKKQLALNEMEQNNAAQEALCQKLSEQVKNLPTEAELHLLRQELDRATSNCHTAKLELAFAPEAPKKPQAPACFLGLSGAQALARQKEDAEIYRTAQAVQRPKKTAAAICALICVLAAALCFLNLYVGIGAVVLSAAFLLFSLRAYFLQERKWGDAQREAERILSRYGVAEIERTALLVQDYARQCDEYDAAMSSHEARARQTSERLSNVEAELERVLQKIRRFAPESHSADLGAQAIQTALQAHSRHTSELRTLDLQRLQLRSARQLFGASEQFLPDPEALEIDEAKLVYEKNAAAERVKTLSLRLSEQSGKLSATGDATTLCAELDSSRGALSEVQRQLHVLSIASEALMKADETLRARFSPQITAEAAKILSKLTGGKYNALRLEPNMLLSTREQSDALMRPAAAMSCGTADQMYLALRLAMVHRLLPDGTPLLLDDALVNFDDARCAAALKLLSEENRQIILFSCKEMPYVL